MLRKLSMVVVVLVASLSPALASGDPHGGAGAFTAAIPNLTATDRCEEPLTGCVYQTPGVAMDLAGRIPRVVSRPVADCPIQGGGRPRQAHDVQLLSPGGEAQTLGTFLEYCEPPYYSSRFASIKLALDPFNGVLYADVSIMNYTVLTLISSRTAQVGIAGLPSLFDIMLTYQPGGTLSWATPLRPLGLPSADRFQVFTGALGHAPLFQDAQPVACSLPAGAAPVYGDVVSIADPLPVPPVGEGRYVVVAAERAGEHRYGRQRIGGVTTGRNPADFPACQ